ncbi:hypothetical protein BJ138DRAFT_322285 [Hygrophoropsis aurantiaca]|uniref:Uncharacterized protein n=1 Tax=Hygrophoropsis aurantiaca TaxID=72124 RepID=A0ACB8A6L1_9AGAM|nr:hypothetical protein BJ138DRAFT_322285 [Hygrophoropsis aurantiaca]
MERIKEYWDHNSVTTVFRIAHNKGRPVGCEEDTFIAFTDDCGLGWNCGIAYDICEPEIDTFFRFTEGKWLASYGTSITLFISLMRDLDDDTSEKKFAEQVTIPTPDQERIQSWHPRDIISHPIISFKVTLGARVDVDGMMKKKIYPSPETSVINPALRVILQRALVTGMCFDIKFLARSSRASSRRIEPLYAHSIVLNAVQPALLRLLCSNSSNPDKAPIDDPHHKGSRYNLEYDVSLGEYATDCDSEYDSDSESDEAEVKDEHVTSTDALIEESTPYNHSSPTALREPPPAYHPTCQNAVRTIRVHGVASKTLKALIYHCYTAEIHFSPLDSLNANKAEDQSVVPDRFYCSPKSMYRLADRIGAEELKELSLESIRSSLSKHNILDEVFSHFTSRHPEVLNMELDLLVANICEPEVVRALPTKMKSVVSGALPYSDEILLKVFMQRMK